MEATRGSPQELLHTVLATHVRNLAQNLLREHALAGENGRTINRMTTFGQLVETLNNTGADFLFTELHTALTFLNVAATSGSEEGRVRNTHNALKAYETVLQHAPEVMLTLQQREEMAALLSTIRQRLQESGAERTSDAEVHGRAEPASKQAW